jgi:hypothetical protein
MFIGILQTMNSYRVLPCDRCCLRPEHRGEPSSSATPPLLPSEKMVHIDYISGLDPLQSHLAHGFQYTTLRVRKIVGAGGPIQIVGNIQ